MKPVYKLTREELILENIELRKQIDRLESKLNMQADVFDSRTLDKIIEDCKEAGNQEQKPLMPFGTRKKQSGNLNDFMSSYKKYRRIARETVVDKDLKLDASAYSKLAEWKASANN